MMLALVCLQWSLVAVQAWLLAAANGSWIVFFALALGINMGLALITTLQWLDHRHR